MKTNLIEAVRYTYSRPGQMESRLAEVWGAELSNACPLASIIIKIAGVNSLICVFSPRVFFVIILIERRQSRIKLDSVSRYRFHYSSFICLDLADLWLFALSGHCFASPAPAPSPYQIERQQSVNSVFRCKFDYLYTHLFIHILIRSFKYSFIHSYIHLFIQIFINAFINISLNIYFL